MAHAVGQRTARAMLGSATAVKSRSLNHVRPLAVVVTLALLTVGLPASAFAAGTSTTLGQLEGSLAGAAGHGTPSKASLRGVGSLAHKLAGQIAHPSPSCKKGLAAAERLAGDRLDRQRLRNDLRAARTGIRTCKPVKKPTPGSGSGGGSTGTGPTKPAPPTKTPPPVPVMPQSGLGTVNEIKIVSTWRFHGVGSQDFCWNIDPSKPEAIKYFDLYHNADLTYESDIHLDRTQAGSDSLDLASGSSNSITPQPPCTVPRGYQLGGWTNGELNAALEINDPDGTGAVALSVAQDVLDQAGGTVSSYGPGLPPSAGDGTGADWISQYTYPGFETGMSEEIDWPAGIDGGAPSITYTPLGIGGHVVAQLHETKSLDSSPSLMGTADILIELLSS